MKRNIAAIICILALAVSFLTACTVSEAADTSSSTQEKNEAVLSAYIVEKDKNDLLVTADSGLYFVSIKNAKVQSGSKELETEKLKAGMSVLIGFNGAVLESYPAQIAADSVKILSETDDKISLYSTALKHLCNDEGFFSDIKTVALDFSTPSLSEPQKTALCYVLSNYLRSKAEVDVIQSSYKELEKDGRIKDGSYKDGIILSVEENENNTFSVSWYIGPLGAEGYSGCTAKMRGGEWKIDYGTAWIS